MKALRYVSTFIAVVGVLFGGAALYNYLATSHAERSATRFCDRIKPNTSIAIALKRANNEEISYLYRDWYKFYFPAAFFDIVTCEVETDPQGLVKSKSVHISRD